MKSLLLPCIFCFLAISAFAQTSSSLDERVKQFLESHRDQWHDLNIPYQDGQVLYDLIVEHHYTAALEIGTSTGHSTIWLAWALSKTGGKLITVEINEQRQKEAIENLKAVGLLEYVDARLANAHELVKEVDGPFDFVFSDADKDWYTQYFKDVDPKLKVGGCFTAHNVRNNFGGIGEFLEYVQQQDNYDTSINKASSSGISISYKRAE